MFAKLLLLACFAMGAYQDLRSLRVSNWLTLGGALAAGLWLCASGHSLTGYPPGVVLIGLALALALSVPGYLLGRLGAADVKALAALAVASDPRSPYYRLFWNAEAEAEKLLKSSRLTPHDVAKYVLRAMTIRRPRLRYVVGRRARLVLSLRRHLPGEMFERFYFGELLRRTARDQKSSRNLPAPSGLGGQDAGP